MVKVDLADMVYAPWLVTLIVAVSDKPGVALGGIVTPTSKVLPAPAPNGPTLDGAVVTNELPLTVTANVSLALPVFVTPNV